MKNFSLILLMITITLSNTVILSETPATEFTQILAKETHIKKGIWEYEYTIINNSEDSLGFFNIGAGNKEKDGHVFECPIPIKYVKTDKWLLGIRQSWDDQTYFLQGKPLIFPMSGFPLAPGDTLSGLKIQVNCRDSIFLKTHYMITGSKKSFTGFLKEVK